MQSAIVQQPLNTVPPNSNLTIVMLQVEVGFISKHIVVPFRCRCSLFIAPLTAQTFVVSSQGYEIHHYHAHNPLVIMGSGATRWVRSAPSVRHFLLHSAKTDLHQSCLVLSNTVTFFSER
ncbi:hypothetical protein TNCV_3955831 [Trichonephila clavipes]|nr:hypothetical protein TNCV_3955831 [Trichonephila clavipes]